MSAVRCDRVGELLPGLVDDSALGGRFLRAHVRSCLRCQAELAQYRRLRRTARSLEREVWVPPVDLLDAILVRLERAGDRTANRTRRVAVYLGGVATAVGAAGALLLTRRARPRTS
jgi:hypothetical protein